MARVSATFLEPTAADRIVTWYRLRILLHHPAECALVHRLNELRLDRHLGIRAMLVNEFNTRLLASQIAEVHVMEDLVVVLMVNISGASPLVGEKLPLLSHQVLLLLLQLMRCLL